MNSKNKNEIKVFLSGGTRGDWQDGVKNYFAKYKTVTFFDPRNFPKGTSMKEIAETERAWLDLADIVFFFFEDSNPSGLGSAFEVGYAVANGMPVIFVDEKRTSHTEWLGVHCNETFEDMEQGLKCLKSYIDRRT